MKISSPVFPHLGMIPGKYTCDGENVSPPLTFLDVPPTAVSLVLVVDDPDAKLGTWDHWLAWNIDPKTTAVEENKVPAGAVQGMNSFGFPRWGGPCPPMGTHRYFFKLYAMDTMISFEHAVQKEQLFGAMQSHVLEVAELIGRYHR